MSGFFGSALTDQSGKFNRQDDFANLQLNDNIDGYDFEDTYDGLGDQLEEANDDFNDDTFGSTAVGKDFDFSGKTAKASDTLEEEQLAFQRRKPAARPLDIDRSVQFQGNRPILAKSAKDAWSGPPQGSSDIWSQSHAYNPQATASTTANAQSRSNPVSFKSVPQARKFQTLEEVEAAMLASSKSNFTSRPADPVSILSKPKPQEPSRSTSQTPMFPPGNLMQHDPQAYMHVAMEDNIHMPGAPGAPIPRQLPPGIVQTQGQSIVPEHPSVAQGYPQPLAIHSPKPGRPVVSLKQAIQEDETVARAQQEKNLRRAQKIGRMARYNGIMSNGDKNYVLKVQISQLVSEDPEADDFYYTVHSTLRGRNNIQQSLGHFEQTYLSRSGQFNRRGNRDKQNPMLKMQQQVQKIVASAKSRPKSNSLAMEGSLGKLSFSRVRQPKQVLNVKMPEKVAPLNKQSKKEALQNIESIYSTLLLLEHTGRQVLPEQAPPEVVQSWKNTLDELLEKIWTSLHIMDEVDDSQLHPFIQLLQYAKGKKLIPRLYRNLSPERRLTLITMIVAHLDLLDVVRLARYDESGTLPRELREDIDLFTHTVLPPLLLFTSSAPMQIVAGLLKMLVARNNTDLISMSKIGLSFMTMFISRAEIAKQAEQADESELSSWQTLYNHFFSVMEGKFGLIFPPPSHHVDEIYPWQFLAACAVSASPEQQHALVNEARDRVLDNVQSAKGLPKELADTKRANVNLFLHAIGLDASQLEG